MEGDKQDVSEQKRGVGRGTFRGHSPVGPLRRRRAFEASGTCSTERQKRESTYESLERSSVADSSEVTHRPHGRPETEHVRPTRESKADLESSTAADEKAGGDEASQRELDADKPARHRDEVATYVKQSLFHVLSAPPT